MLQVDGRVATSARADNCPDSKDVLSNMYKLGARRWRGSKRKQGDCLTSRVAHSVMRKAAAVKTTLQWQMGREVSIDEK